MSTSAAPHSIPAPVKKPEIVAPAPAPAKPSSGRPWKWLLLLAVIVIGYFAYRALQGPSPAEKGVASTAAIRTAKVTTGSVDRTTRIAGQTAAIEYANIAAPTLRGPDSNREMILM